MDLFETYAFIKAEMNERETRDVTALYSIVFHKLSDVGAKVNKEALVLLIETALEAERN